MEMKSNASLVACGDEFRIEAEPGRNSITIRPTGLINEDINFGTVLEFVDTLQTKPERIVFDMSGITRMNSCGVREWLLFLQRVQSRFRCSFSKVNVTFIEMASSIPTMLGDPGLPLEEFEATFYCAKCSRSFVSRLKPDAVFKSDIITLPPQPCLSCGSPTEFDGLQEEYFRFLRHVTP